MRKMLLRVLVAVLVSGLISSASIAEDVCVTKHGKKYHKMGSRFIKDREFEVISREEAETRGYKPSSDFFRKNSETDGETGPVTTDDVTDTGSK